MTPGARLQAAIEILDEIGQTPGAERVLTRWARSNRYAGSKDRAAVRDHVYDVIRRRRSALYASGQERESGRALVSGLLALTAPGDLALFDGAGHAPAPLTDAERAALRPDLAGAPDPVRLDCPDGLFPEITRSLGARTEAVLDDLRSRAPVDLRVNIRKTDISAAIGELAADGIEVAPLDAVPGALRVVENPRKVAGSAAYRQGRIELQDAASQMAALAAQPEPGAIVVDLCAGGGGKTLALAAQMSGGQLFAYDANPGRMRDLPQRAKRAGATVVIADDKTLSRIKGTADLVFVDAPCSGTGAWRRNPERKWQMDTGDLHQLLGIQAGILERAIGLLRPGGRLIYATCSLLNAENGDQIAALRSRHSGLTVVAERTLLPNAPGDGFYFCVLSVNIQP